MRSGVGDGDYEDGIATPGPMFRPVRSEESGQGTELVEAQDEVYCVECGRPYPSLTLQCPRDGAAVLPVQADV
jgi:hypothetical protein